MDTIKIPLSKGRFATIDAADWDRVKAYKWNVDSDGYAYSSQPKEKGGNIMLHRFLLNLPKRNGVCVDHINGDRLDNCRENLRPCSVAENSRNRAKQKQSKYTYKGVKRDGKSWRAYISVGGFETEEAAATEYDRLAIFCHGAFARLNLPRKIINLVTPQIVA